MRISEYVTEVDALLANIRGLVPSCTIRIGVGGNVSNLKGELIAPSGYRLNVPIERFIGIPRKAVVRSFRYEILQPDSQSLLRLQTDKRGFATNAHVRGAAFHLPEHRWPERIQRPDFLKVYRLFQEIIDNDGALPPPFDMPSEDWS